MSEGDRYVGMTVDDIEIQRFGVPPRQCTCTSNYIGPCHGAAPQPANTEQIGGDHYKRMGIQPWDVYDTWPLEQRIGAYRSDAIKYLMRAFDKNTPLENVQKAEHLCRKLAEVLRETGKD